MLNSNRPYWAALLFVLYLVVNTAHAVSIESTGSRYESGGVRYFFTVTSWEGGGHSICDSVRYNRCSIRLVGAQAPGDYVYMVSSTHGWEVKPSRSMTEVRNQMSGFLIPFQGSLFVPQGEKRKDSFCIAFSHSYPSTLVTPVGPCAPVIQPALKCEIKGNTTIDHENVSDAAIDGLSLIHI